MKLNNGNHHNEDYDFRIKKTDGTVTLEANTKEQVCVRQNMDYARQFEPEIQNRLRKVDEIRAKGEDILNNPSKYKKLDTFIAKLVP